MVYFNRGNKGSFIWDPIKELANIDKHGVNFVMASQVFADHNRKIYKDPKHSLTVRFTYRESNIRIIGAGFWRKGKDYYEEKD